MERAIAVVGMALIATMSFAAVAPAAGYQNFIQGVFFTDTGGNNAQATILYGRDSSDVPELKFLFTTSDTEMYTFPGTLASANVVGTVIVSCTVLEVAGMIDQSCFTADRAYRVTAINQIHTIKEDATALTIMPTKQTGTETPTAGKDLLSAGFNALSTAQTVQNGALTSTAADLELVAGDRLGLDFTTGATGELQGVVVTFTLVPS